MADNNAVLYAAVYNEVEGALSDLEAFQRLHKDEMLGKYDAAVIDNEDGKPHIVKRADSPAIRVIPEWVGSGTLRRKELHDAAQALAPGQAELIVVGDPTLEQGFERAVTRSAKTAKRDLNAAIDELEAELTHAAKS
ncbi:MAG TPA: hypothetical protein VKR21_09650 [Solirubrobacteraceae bacterium]|nr:hypothetical protein [Solirubrobacteraceae bacterium]